MDKDIYNPNSQNNSILGSVSSNGQTKNSSQTPIHYNTTTNEKTSEGNYQNTSENAISSIYSFFANMPLWLQILLIIILSIVLIISLLKLIQSQKTYSAVYFIIMSFIIIILEMTLVETLFNIIERFIFKDEKMRLYDYIWYILFMSIIMVFLATIIKTVSNNFNVRINLLFTTVVLAIVLIYYTVIYYLIKHIDKIGSVFIYLTIIIIVITIIFVFINNVFPHIVDSFNLNIIYSFIVSFYFIIIVIIVIRFLYQSITKPNTIIDTFSYFNIFQQTRFKSYLPIDSVF